MARKRATSRVTSRKKRIKKGDTSKKSVKRVSASPKQNPKRIRKTPKKTSKTLKSNPQSIKRTVRTTIKKNKRRIKKAKPAVDIKLIDRFYNLYFSTEFEVRDNNLELAGRKYLDLLEVYKQIQKSDADTDVKLEAYAKTKEIYKGIKRKDLAKSMNSVAKAVPFALFILAFLLVFAIKPDITGFFGVDTTDSAPEWQVDADSFDIVNSITINLDDYFYDSDGDEITYVATTTDDLAVDVTGEYLTVMAVNPFVGERQITVIASDLNHHIKKKITFFRYGEDLAEPETPTLEQPAQSSPTLFIPEPEEEVIPTIPTLVEPVPEEEPEEVPEQPTLVIPEPEPVPEETVPESEVQNTPAPAPTPAIPSTLSTSGFSTQDIFTTDYSMTNQDNISWVGEASSFAGTSLDWADINGDGYADAIVGAPDNNSYNGAVYILYGPLDQVTDANLVAKANVTFSGLGSYFLGTCVGSGDFDDDGYDDLVIGAWQGDSGDGAAFLVYGQSANLNSGVITAVADANITGDVGAGTYMGSQCDSADLNGDDYDDILIGDADYDMTWLIYGKSTKFSFTDSIDDVFNISWAGASTSASYVVARAGDVNNDGYDDILIGAPYNTSNTGTAYLIYGGPTVSSQTAHTLPTGTNATFGAETATDYLGMSVSSAGDVNGDDYDDFLISAPYHNAPGETADDGRVYLFYGGAGIPWTGYTAVSSANATFTGDQMNGFAGLGRVFVGYVFGSGALSYGDFNADGYSDFIIGVPQYDSSGKTDNGKVVLYYGKSAIFSGDHWLNTTDANATFYGEEIGVNDWLAVVPRGMAEDVNYQHIMMSAYDTNSAGGGSCPFLYSWDGTSYKLSGDLFNQGMLGVWNALGRRAPYPDDYQTLADGFMVPDEGLYKIEIKETSDEAVYIDEVKLYQVDHSDDVEIVSAGSAWTTVFNESKTNLMTLHTISNNPQSPVNCLDRNNTDCLAQITTENIPVPKSELTTREFRTSEAVLGTQFEWDSLTLDLGNLSDASVIKLVLNGVTYWPSQREWDDDPKAEGTWPAYMQVVDENGSWSNATYISIPNGYNEKYAFEIQDYFLTENYTIKLNIFAKSDIDYVAIDTTVDETINLVELNMHNANLTPFRFGTQGFQGENSTRYGEVKELLNHTDDKFAIFVQDDQISLEFNESDVAIPEGKERDFILYSVGYFKQEKYGMERTIEPLPFYNMSNYPYNTSIENYPFDEDHIAYLTEYNTRETYDPDSHHSDEGKVYIMLGEEHAGAVTIMSCADNITGSAILAANITATGNCMIINGSDLSLDCQGNSIVGDGSGIGINTTLKESVTLKDCNISNFTDSIYISDSNSTTIESTILADDIHVYNSTGTTLSNADTITAFFVYESNSTTFSSPVTATTVHVYDSDITTFAGSVTVGTIHNNRSTSTTFTGTISSNLINNHLSNRTTFTGSIPSALNITDSYYVKFQNSDSSRQIRYTGLLTGYSSNYTGDVIFGDNGTYIDSSGGNGFNASANITFTSFSSDNPKVIFALGTSSTFAYCTAATDPKCYELSYGGSGVSADDYVFNVSHFTNFTIQDEPFECGAFINRSYNLTKDYHCSGDGFILGTLTTGMIFDCKGYSITGSGSGIGILNENGTIVDSETVLIRGCSIDNFSTGILLNRSTYPDLRNSTMYNNTDGIIIDSARAGWGWGLGYNALGVNSSQNSRYGILVINDSQSDAEIYYSNIENNGKDNIRLVNVTNTSSSNGFRTGSYSNFSGAGEHDITMIGSHAKILGIGRTGSIETYNFSSSSVLNFYAYNSSGSTTGYMSFYDISLNANGTNLSSDINFHNGTHMSIDSTAQPEFNRSATVRLYAIRNVDDWSRMFLEMDVDGDGTYEANCTSGTAPACYNLSTTYSFNPFTFNTTHFTGFRVIEGAWDCCGQVLYESMNLSANHVGSVPCIYFGEDNLYVDCKGYNISGLRTNGLDNATIHNCTIVNSGYGIHADYTEGLLVSNSTFIGPSGSTQYPIKFVQANNAIIENNLFKGNLRTGDTTLLSVLSPNGIIKGNNFTTNYSTRIDAIKMFYASTENITIFDNDISGFRYGVTNYHVNPPNKFNITGNRFDNVSSYNVFLQSSHYNTIHGNVFEGNDTVGTILFLDGDYTNITGNTFQNASDSGDYGIYSNYGADNNLIKDNLFRRIPKPMIVFGHHHTFHNNTMNNSGYGGISTALFELGGDYNNLSKMIIDNSNGSALLINGRQGNIVNLTDFRFYNSHFVDMQMASCTGQRRNVFLDNPGAATTGLYNFTISNSYFIYENSTAGRINYTSQIVSTGIIHTGLESYMNVTGNLVTVNPTGGLFNKSARITLYNLNYVDPRPQYDTGSGFADCTGATDPACVELGYDNDGYRFSNTHFTQFRASDNSSIDCGSTITTDITLSSDIACSSSGAWTIGADNLLVNCNGYTVSGAGVGDGVGGSGYDNITVANCTFTGFNGGVSLASSEGHYIGDSNFISNNIGVYFNAVNYSRVDNFNISSSTNYGIYDDDVGGDGKYNNFTNGEITGSHAVSHFISENSNVFLFNNTITGGSDTWPHIWFNSGTVGHNVSTNTIASCGPFDCITLSSVNHSTFEDNSINGYGRGGIFLESGSAYNTVKGNTVDGNYAGTASIWVHSTAGEWNNITSNNVYESYWYGYLVSTDNNRLEHNTVSAYVLHYGLYLDSNVDNTFVRNYTCTPYYWCYVDYGRGSVINDTPYMQNFAYFNDTSQSYVYWAGPINLTNTTNKSAATSLKFNLVDIDSTNYPWLNESSSGWFTSIRGYVDPIIRVDWDSDGNMDDVCDFPECNITGYGGDWVLDFQLSHFTGYEIDNNSAPTQGTPVINSSSGGNASNENLTVWNQTTADSDGHKVKNIYNWYKNGKPIGVLNMPFEVNRSFRYTAGSIKDYTIHANNGTAYSNHQIIDNMETNASWTASHNLNYMLNNTATFREGAAGQSFVKVNTSSGSADFFFQKTISILNMTVNGTKVGVWLYIKDDIVMDNISNVEIFLFNADGKWYNTAVQAANLELGWNLIQLDNETAGTSAVAPDPEKINTIRIDVNTDDENVTFAAGDVIVDYWMVGFYDLEGPGWTKAGGYDGEGAYVFDGQGDYIEVNDSGSLDLGRNFSLEAWVKLDSLPSASGNVMHIITKGPAPPQQNYNLYVHTNNKFVYAYSGGGIGNTRSILSTTTATTGVWYHVAASSNSTNVSLYINGTKETETSSVTSSIGSSSLFIGARGATDGFFNGTIDDVKVYNHTMTAEQVLANYNSGNGKYDTLVTTMISPTQNWSADITGNDGYADSSKDMSVNLTVLSGCGDTLLVSRTLSSNLTSTGTCFTVGANSITIDCAGYNISGDGTGSGIFMSGKTGVILKNCGISNFSKGVDLDATSTFWAYNNTFERNIYGVWTNQGSSNLYENNTFSNNINYSYYFTTGGGGTIMNNNFTNNIFEDSTSEGGLYLADISNSRFVNNTIRDNAQYGIYIGGSTFSGNLFENNTLVRNGNDSIFTTLTSTNNNYTMNTFSNSSGRGIAFTSNAPSGDRYLYNVIKHNTEEGVYFGGMTNVNFKYNNISFNNYSQGNGAFYVSSSSTGVNFTHNNVSHNHWGAVNFLDVDNVFIKNNYIDHNNGSGATSLSYGNMNNKFEVYNNTFRFNNFTGGNLIDGIGALGNVSFNTLIGDYTSNGIQLTGDQGVMEIYNNTITRCSNGIVASTGSGSYAYVHHNLLENNTNGIQAGGGGGFSTANITYNTVRFNTNNGISLDECTNNNVSRNTVDNNSNAGIQVGGAGGTADNNIFSDNLVRDNTNYGYHFSGANNHSVIRNGASGSSTDLYVASSNEIHVIDVSFAGYSLNSAGMIFDNLSVGQGVAQARYLTTITESGTDLIGSSTSDIRLAANYTFVNSTAQPGLNASANVTFYNVGFNSRPQMYADRNDDGVYEENCFATGICTFLSHNALGIGHLVFNVSHFTAYSAGLNVLPNHTTPILNATNISNRTRENLTLYSQNGFDLDNDSLTNITNWYVDNSSITLVNIPFDSNISQTGHDYSPYQHTALFIHNLQPPPNDNAPPTWVAGGISGGAFYFNGTLRQDLEIFDTNYLDLNESFTVEFWVKRNKVALQTILSKSTTVTENYQFDIIPGSEIVSFRIMPLEANPNARTANTTTGLTLGWVYIVGTYDHIVRNLSIYYNGALEGTGYGFNDITNATTASSLVIGAYGGTTAHSLWFDGTIDELKIHNRSLSADQIWQNYNNNVPKYDIIVGNETVKNEIWHANVTVNDGTGDGPMRMSNVILIENTPPSAPTQTYPPNASRLLNVTMVPLNCSGSTDDDGDTIYYMFYADQTDGSTYIGNSTSGDFYFNGTSNETNYWMCGAHDLDDHSDLNSTVWQFSRNVLPTQGKPIVSSTTSGNYSDENLTVYPQNVNDDDNDPLTNITNWFINGVSWTVLNMPFDTNLSFDGLSFVKDYTPYENNGTLGGGVSREEPGWTKSGKLGGAYVYDGGLDFINISDDNSLDLTEEITIEGWFKPAIMYNDTAAGHQGIIDKGPYSVFLDKSTGRLRANFDTDHSKSWLPSPRGFNSGVAALHTFEGDLIAGGGFTAQTYFTSVDLNRTARYNSSSDKWRSIGEGFLDNITYAFTTWNGTLVAGGSFNRLANGSTTSCLAMFNGSEWQPNLKGGTSGAQGGGPGCGPVYALISYDDKLFAGGNFNDIGDCCDPGDADSLAFWDGTNWTGIGMMQYPSVLSLIVYKDELYAGGSFEDLGAVSPEPDYIGRWNKTGITTWHQLGSGISGSDPSFNTHAPSVATMAVYKGELYAGGRFDGAGGAGVHNIAKWNGTTWSDVGGGLGDVSIFTNSVATLTVVDGYLYAGGLFNETGNKVDISNNTAKWDGSTWSNTYVAVSVGSYSGSKYPSVFAEYDGNLVAGGNFDTIAYWTTVLDADYIATFDGYDLALESTTSNWNPSSWYHFVATFDNDTGASLYINGVLENSTSASNQYLVDSTDHNLMIGKSLGSRISNGGYDEYFAGTIDEVRIYNRYFGAEQVLLNYNNFYTKVASSSTNPDEQWAAAVTPNDGYGDGETKISENITITWAPTTVQMVLNSTGLTYISSDNLTCYVEGRFASGGNINAHYKWFKDGVDQTSIAGSTVITNGTLSLVSTLNSANITTGGENWTCSVLMGVGTKNESNWNNESLIIGSNCGETLSADKDYILTTNISTSGASNCLTVGGDNVDMDGKGYSISSIGGTGTAFYTNTLRNNFQMRNCTINGFGYGVNSVFSSSRFEYSTFNGSSSRMIYITGLNSDYNVIAYNTFMNAPAAGDYGVYLNQGGSTTISDNNFTNNNGYDIQVASSLGNSIRYNTFDKNSINSYVFYFSTSSGATVEDNTITNAGTGSSSWGYYFSSIKLAINFVGTNLVDSENASEYFVYDKNNTIFENLNHDGSVRVLNLGNFVAYNCNNLTVKNSNFSEHSAYQVRMQDVTNSTVENNNISKASGAGYGLRVSQFENLAIKNNTVKAVDNSAIDLYVESVDNSQDAVIEHNTISCGGGDGIMLRKTSTAGDAKNVTVQHNTGSCTSTSGYFVYLDVATTGNTFYNITVYNNTVSGGGSAAGIYSENPCTNITNNTISNCGSGTGIMPLGRGDYQTIYGNTISDCRYGMYLASEYNNISKNNFTDNSNWGIYVTSELRNNISHDNLINGKEPYYYHNEPGVVIEDLDLNITQGVSSGVVTVVDSSGVTIRNNQIMGYGASTATRTHGIGMYNVSDSSIANNTINKSEHSIYASGQTSGYDFNNNTIENNTFNANLGNYQIYLDHGAKNNTIKNNYFYDGKGYGVGLVSTYVANSVRNNTIANNDFRNHSQTIYLTSVQYNTIENNSIDQCRMFGISLYYLSQYNVIKYNNFTNFTGTGAAACLGCGGSNAHSVIENRFHDNYINGTYYGIKWDDSYQNNTAYNNEIYHASSYALMFDPDNYEQNVYNNTICYNRYSMSFSTGRNFGNVKVHNNSFCIIGMDPTNGSSVSDRTPLLKFNATNIVGTECTALIDGVHSGKDDVLGADNTEQSIQVNWTLSRGWYELNYTCNDTYDDTAVPNTLDFYITNEDPTHSSPWIGAHQPIGSYADDNLVSYWQFEGGSEKINVSIDSAATINGTNQDGVSHTDDGKVGSAYKFDGIDDNIEVGAASGFNYGTGNYTYSAWFKADSFSGANMITRSAWASQAAGFSIYTSSNVLYCAGRSSGSSEIVASNAFTDTSGWHHVVCTRTDGVIDGYLDGVIFTTSGTSGADSNLASHTRTRIGADSAASPGSFWNGTIDDVMVYNRSLTLSEVRERYMDSQINDSSTVTTDQDLGVASNNTADEDADGTVKIFNWYRNGTSIAVLNMPFESNKSATTLHLIRDYSPYGNNGTLGGASLAYVPNWTDQGRNGSTGAYVFDGADDYVDLGNPSTLNQDFGELSISFWMFANSTTGSDAGLVGKGSSIYGTTYHTNGNVYFYIQTGGNSVSAAVGTGAWHHIVGTFNGTHMQLYVDGTSAITSTSSFSSTTTGGSFYVGRATSFFNGTIDEVRIYNRSLTPDQILAEYNLEYNRIASSETLKGENWSATVTPNDNQANSDGPTYSTENVTIKNSDPIVTLYWPNDGNDTLLERQVRLLWNSSDADLDALTYEINLTTNGAGCSNYSWSGITDENYTTPTLCVDEVYYWAARADDGTVNGSFSSTWNFTIPSTIILTLTTNSTSFEGLRNMDSNDTVDNNPPPFEIRNDGNIHIDLKIFAQDYLWDSVTLNNSYFQTKSDNSTTEPGSYDEAAAESATAWVNINGTDVLSAEYIIGSLNWSNATDEAEIELNLTVPAAEHSGSKNSTLVVIGEAT